MAKNKWLELPDRIYHKRVGGRTEYLLFAWKVTVKDMVLTREKRIFVFHVSSPFEAARKLARLKARLVKPSCFEDLPTRQFPVPPDVMLGTASFYELRD